MKPFAILIVVFIVLATTLTGQSKSKPHSIHAGATTQTVVINVPTAVCVSCEVTITMAVKKVANVKKVKVNAEKKTATVSFASGSTTLDKLEKAISKAGYDANQTKRDPAAYEKFDECCKKD